MPKPTERALKRHPQAVVLFSFESNKADKEAGDKDFEWFDSDENRVKYFDEAHSWNVKDVADHGELVYLTAEVMDTASMTLGRVEIAPTDNVDLIDWKVRVGNDPSLLLVAAPAAKSTADKKVKARKPSPAANGVAKSSGPKVRKVVAPKGDGPKPADKAALKKRLAAKQAAPKAKDEMAALDAAVEAPQSEDANV